MVGRVCGGGKSCGWAIIVAYCRFGGRRKKCIAFVGCKMHLMCVWVLGVIGGFGDVLVAL